MPAKLPIAGEKDLGLAQQTVAGGENLRPAQHPGAGEDLGLAQQTAAGGENSTTAQHTGAGAQPLRLHTMMAVSAVSNPSVPQHRRLLIRGVQRTQKRTKMS